MLGGRQRWVPRWADPLLVPQTSSGDVEHHVSGGEGTGAGVGSGAVPTTYSQAVLYTQR